MRLTFSFIIVVALACWYIWSPGGPTNKVGKQSSIAEVEPIQKTQPARQPSQQKVRVPASEVSAHAKVHVGQMANSAWRRTIESTLAQLQKDTEGLDKLPPCEQHKLLREAVLRHEPSPDCPRAKKIYEEMSQGAKRAEEQCRDLSDVFSQILEMGYSCKEDGALETKVELRKIVAKLKGHYQKDLQRHLDDELSDISFDDETLYPVSSGEFRDPTCALVPIIFLQYRYMAFKFHNKHFGMVESEIDSFCVDESYQPFYPDYLRYGEDGNPAKSYP
jgi:hypothetical protein